MASPVATIYISIYYQFAPICLKIAFSDFPIFYTH